MKSSAYKNLNKILKDNGICIRCLKKEHWIHSCYDAYLVFAINKVKKYWIEITEQL